MTTAATAVPIKPKRFFWLTARGWRRVGVVLLGFAGLVALNYSLEAYRSWQKRQIILSPETTALVTPLRPNGHPDYLQAVANTYSAGVTPDNNAALVLLPLLDNLRGPIYAQALGTTYTELKLDPNDSLEHAWCKNQKLDFADLTQAQTQAVYDFAYQLQTQPWQAEQFPFAAQWLETQRPVMALLVRAAEKSHYYVPRFVCAPDAPTQTPGLDQFPTADRLNLFGSDSDQLSAGRHYARAVLAQGYLDLGHGRHAEVRSAIRTLLRLGRLYQQSDRYIMFIIGHTLERQGYQLMIAACGTPLTPEQATALEALLTDLPTAPSVADLLTQSQRWSALDLLCLMAEKHTATACWYTPWAGANYLIADYNRSLRLTNQYYTLLAQTYQTQGGAATLSAAQDFRTTHLNTPLASYDDLLLSLTLSDNPTSIIQYADSTLSQKRLTQITFRLRDYKLAHGQYPQQLSDLNLPVETITDPFRPQPFIYQPQTTGYKLYSVGRNQQDDNGSTHSDITAHQNN
jgi:hypothetical protein